MSSLTAESIYSDAATLGKTSSYIYFIVAIVIAVILVIYALHINSQPQKPSVRAFIITASCTTFNTGDRNNNISYSCLLNVKYKVNEIEYVNNLTTTSNNVYNPNTYIDIEYDLDNPNNINIKGMDNATQSKISVGIAVLIVVASGISYYLSQKSDVYAAGQGVHTVASIFRR
jgi:hypothetical protein